MPWPQTVRVVEKEVLKEVPVEVIKVVEKEVIKEVCGQLRFHAATCPDGLDIRSVRSPSRSRSFERFLWNW